METSRIAAGHSKPTRQHHADAGNSDSWNDPPNKRQRFEESSSATTAPVEENTTCAEDEAAALQVTRLSRLLGVEATRFFSQGCSSERHTFDIWVKPFPD